MKTTTKPEAAETYSPPERKSFIPGDLKALIARQPFFKGLTSEQIDLLKEAAMEETYDAGETILREDDPANRFYIILEGKVLLELDNPEDGKVPVQTLGPGEDLGWSWLFPPHFMRSSARALEPTKVLFFYGTELRERCEQDPVFGYELMKRAAGAMLQSLKATRRQLLKRVNNDESFLQSLQKEFSSRNG